MNRRRVAVLLTVVGLQVIALAGLASAVPVGGCPTGWELMTRAELRQELEEVPRERFDLVFDAYDKNGDDRLCAKEVPAFLNVIDNTANRP